MASMHILEWKEILQLAEDPAIEFVISNTTEAGIVYSPEDKLTDNPPNSFPANLLLIFIVAISILPGPGIKGMIIMPVELIERNGRSIEGNSFKTGGTVGITGRFSKMGQGSQCLS